MPCWLCEKQGDPLSKKMNDFIVANIGYMDIHCIACQIADYLCIQQPNCGAEGGDEASIYCHIISHILHPKVRLAVMLRQLLELHAVLQNSIIVRDGPNVTLDKGNVDLYLKVQGQIIGLYKSETQGMMFATEDEANVARTK